MHSRARVASAEGQVEEAVALWRSAAEAASPEGQQAVAVWLMLQAAGALKDANRMDAGHQLLEPVFAWADRGSDAATLIALHEAQGQICERQNDFGRADSSYRRVLEIRQRGGHESLALTKAMTDIAFAAFGRGDLDAAEASLRNVLRIQQKLAPGSLAVAKTFNNLGAGGQPGR
jgi:Tfp pilus assembly protein PilF